MIVAVAFSLLVGLAFCLILCAGLGLPVHMAIAYVAAGIAASLVVLRLATRRDPLRHLMRYYVLGGLVGAAVGVLTNGLFLLRFKFTVDAAGVAGLLGGLGAVLFTILSTATARPPKAHRDTGEDARFFRSLKRMARRGEVQRWRPDLRDPNSALDPTRSSRNNRSLRTATAHHAPGSAEEGDSHETTALA